MCTHACYKTAIHVYLDGSDRTDLKESLEESLEVHRVIPIPYKCG